MNLPPRATLAALVSHWLQGWLLVAVRTRHPAQFLNLCAQRGVRIWRVQRRGEVMLLHMPVGAFRQLRPVRRIIGGRVRIRQRHGLPFMLRRIKRRRWLWAASAVAALSVWYWSTFVWTVTVAGTDALQPDIVLAVARQAGLYPGVSRWRVDMTAVEHALEREFPAVAQAIVSRRGTRVTITIVEHRLAPEPAAEPTGDLVAAHAGIVDRVVVVTGHAVVKAGDFVRKNETLILGDFMSVPLDRPGAEAMLPDPDSPPPVTWQWVPPRGEVWARVWHRHDLTVPLEWDEPVRTGRQATVRIIRWNGRELLKWGRQQVPFTSYETGETSQRSYSWRSQGPAVEFLTTTYYETKPVPASRTEAEARQLAEARAVAAVLPLLPPGSQLVGLTVHEVPSPDGKSIRFETYVEALQDIAVHAEHGGGS